MHNKMVIKAADVLWTDTMRDEEQEEPLTMTTAGPLGDSSGPHTGQNWERLKCRPPGQESSVIAMALSSQKPTPH